MLKLREADHGKRKNNQSDNLFLSLHCNIWKVFSVDVVNNFGSLVIYEDNIVGAKHLPHKR